MPDVSQTITIEIPPEPIAPPVVETAVPPMAVVMPPSPVLIPEAPLPITQAEVPATVSTEPALQAPMEAVITPQAPMEAVNQEQAQSVAATSAVIQQAEIVPVVAVVPVVPTGRPCGYCKNEASVMKTVNEFIERSKDRSTGAIPFLEELCMLLDIDEDTMSNWANKKRKDADGKETTELEHPIFFGAYKKIRMIQKLRLQQRTMGRYNPSGAIFLLKANHGLIESEKRIIAGDSTEPLQITFTNVILSEDEQ